MYPTILIALAGKGVPMFKSLNLDIEELPKRLKNVKGNLNLCNYTKLKKLPEGMIIEGSLNLRNCTNLKKLPHNLEVKNGLHLDGCSNIEYIPSTIKAKFIFNPLNLPVKEITNTAHLLTEED